MLFGLLSLKRKIFDTVEEEEEEDDDDVSSQLAESPSPAKRMRIEDSTSIDEENPHNPQISCAAAEAGALPCEEEQQEETEEELFTKVKEAEEMAWRALKQTELDMAVLGKFRVETLSCTVCRGILQNPQTLQCGHSACYPCLRKLWTKLLAGDDHPAIVDTEAESDLDEETHSSHADKSAPPPHPRRRHQFPSAVNRQKTCPVCNKVLTRRPVPNFRLREILATTSVVSLLASQQSRRDVRLKRREDIWNGIFYPETGPNATLYGPSPNDLALALRRAGEDSETVRQRVIDEAYKEGHKAGALDVARQRERPREEERRREEEPRPRRPNEFQFGVPFLGAV